MEMKPPAPAAPTKPARVPRLALALLLAVLGLGLGHAALWHSMAQQLEAGFATWVQVRSAQGWRVDHGPPIRGGWPFSATLTLNGMRLEGGGATLPGGMTLSAERVVLHLTLPRLDRLRVELPAAQRLRIGDQEWGFAADRLSALVPLVADTPPREAELLAERLRIGTPDGPASIANARLFVEASSTATEAEAAFHAILAIEQLDLPAAPGGPAAASFGRRIESLAAEASLTGPVPPGRAPTGRAEAWRDGGGTLELRSLALRWGPVSAAAAATLALDEQLQPMGAGTLRLSGANAALEALAEAGVVGRRAAGTARALLPLVTRPGANGGPPEIEVPVTLEDRTLALARIPVLRLLPWTWPVADPQR
jgi:hypothetical protein